MNLLSGDLGQPPGRDLGEPAQKRRLADPSITLHQHDVSLVGAVVGLACGFGQDQPESVLFLATPHEQRRHPPPPEPAPEARHISVNTPSRRATTHAAEVT
ncbi:hypothetical protein ACFSTC_27050 [Nonomuraea ferruginea]